MKAETLLKAMILTRGIRFSQSAKHQASEFGAKRQNLTYNAPKNYELDRPQELFLTNKEDGYQVVVSCTAPVNNKIPIFIDVVDNQLIAFDDNKPLVDVKISFVKEPEYYSKYTSDQTSVKRLVSSCGLDELNIFPWHDCKISKKCSFCGVNTVNSKNDSKDLLSGHTLSHETEFWDLNKEVYIKNLQEAIMIAKDDECFNEHMHVILISGNLKNDKLNFQAKIYSEIARNIKDLVKDKSTEGIVAVTMPPKDENLLYELKDSGIDIVVFNLEVGQEEYFNKHCPGKAEIGRDFIISSLEKAVSIFGKGKSWCNFVLGLEPMEGLLEVCVLLASKGITPAANILHIDEGNTLKDITSPDTDMVIEFYQRLNKINNKYNLKPYYCQMALRTSLANEAYDGRI